jgi:hypothetical protein
MRAQLIATRADLRDIYRFTISTSRESFVSSDLALWLDVPQYGFTNF